MKHSIQFAILLLSTCGLGQAQDVNDFFSGNGSFELGPFGRCRSRGVRCCCWVRPFDLFLQTKHLECVMTLGRD